MPDDRKRLDGWKEIAGCLGKYLSQKTAQRWEKRDGLPVYREGVRVFAYADELDVWKARRIVAPPTPAEAIEPPLPREPSPRRGRLAALLGMVAAVIALTVWAFARLHAIAPVPPIRIGRFLARATSEDSRLLPLIQLDEQPDHLALRPDGSKLYVSTELSRTLSIVRTADGTVRKLMLPGDGGPLAISPDGRRLYVALAAGNVAVADTGSDVVRSVISTAGPVYSMSFTPDGGKLFLAMSQKGLWRMLAATGELHQITSRRCPELLQVSESRPRLYVTFQCGAVPGRDLFEAFDTRTEQSLGQLQGPPMVGGYPFESPDGRWVLVDGFDACFRPDLHLPECPSVPSRIYHLLRAGDLRIERTLAIADMGLPGGFIDPDRILILGERLTVMDPSQELASEKWESPSETFRSVVMARGQQKAYVGTLPRRQILTLAASASECTPSSEGLAASYPGDGVTTDMVAHADMTASGGVSFGPGRVGQAFVFDGKSGDLHAPWTGHFQFGQRPSSMAAFVKFTQVDGEMAIMDRTVSESAILARLTKAPDNRFHFDFALKQGGPLRLISKTSVQAGRWYHVCVTRTEADIRMYVDGVFEDSRTLGPERTADGSYELAPVYLGATANHRAFLDGKLDEVLFYRRSLSVDEVRHLFQLGQMPACRM